MRRSDIATDVVLAEAAAWLVRLQSAERSPELKSAFQAWIADPAHARAFERASSAWEIIPGAAHWHNEVATPLPPARTRTARWAIAGACALVLLLVSALTLFRTERAVYATKPGQQEVVTLADGTRVTLNTDGEMVVEYRLWERRVQLVHGEAQFEVAAQPNRPFIVAAADHHVRAIGTVFTVRSESEHFTVVLVEGNVEVTRHSPREGPSTTLLILSRGERLSILADGHPRIDRPNLEAELAWLRRQMIFNETALGEAVAEINRYGGTPLKLADPTLQTLRVSGIFHTHDAEEFAAAVAQLDGLRVEHIDGALLLAR